MGGLAALAREAGHRVTGCDTGVYPPMSDQLRQLGIDLTEGYDAAILSQAGFAPDMFVVGNVVSRARLPDGSPRYPLMEAILNQGLPYTSGPQWLAEHVLQGLHAHKAEDGLAHAFGGGHLDDLVCDFCSGFN
jgi:UDP-N-acetylmuramate: L-alanyl-gamma-D-glutamyl-meso-diaminopimelate ligase